MASSDLQDVSSTQHWEDEAVAVFEMDFEVQREEVIRRVEAVALEAICSIGSGRLPVRKKRTQKMHGFYLNENSTATALTARCKKDKI